MEINLGLSFVRVVEQLGGLEDSQNRSKQGGVK